MRQSPAQLFHRRNRVDLNQATGQEQGRAADLDGGARRRQREKTLPDLVELVEQIQVGQEDLRFHDTIQRRAGLLQQARQVRQDDLGLTGDIGAEERAVRVDPRLAGQPILEVGSELARGKNQRLGDDGDVALRERLGQIGGADATRIYAAAGRERDQVNLDATARHPQAGDRYDGQRRQVRKTLAPDLEEAVELGEIGEEHLALHDAPEIRAALAQHRLEVVQNIARLPLDVGTVVGKGRVRASFGRNAGPVVAGDLAGGEEKAAVSAFGMGDDKVDLELAARNEKTLRSDLNRRARRRRRKELLPGRVECLEMREIAQEHLSLDHVLQAAAGFGEHGGQVLQDIRRLRGRIGAGFGWNSGPVIAGDLARRKDKPV